MPVDSFVDLAAIDVETGKGAVAELAIDAPYPRDADFRTSAEYAALCRRVSDALAQAMTAGGRQ